MEKLIIPVKIFEKELPKVFQAVILYYYNQDRIYEKILLHCCQKHDYSFFFSKELSDKENIVFICSKCKNSISFPKEIIYKKIHWEETKKFSPS